MPTGAYSFTIGRAAAVVPSARGHGGGAPAEGWFWTLAPGNTDDDLLSGLSSGLLMLIGAHNQTPLTGLITFNNDQTTENISITHPNSVVSYNGLPSGFVLRSATIWFGQGSGLSGFITSGGGAGSYLYNIALFFNGVVQSFIDSVVGGGSFFIAPDPFDLDMSFPAPTMLDLINMTYGIHVIDISSSNPFIVGSSNLITNAGTFISGTYDIVTSSFTWTVSAVDDPITHGSKVSVLLDPTDIEQPQLSDIVSIDITVDGVTVTIYNPFANPETYDVGNYWYFFQISGSAMQFYIPSGFGRHTGTMSFRANIVSSFFTGSVELGTLEYLFEDGTGLYRVVKGKTNDTIYSPTRDGTTIDVAIPSPFVRTGYIGG